ncbi:ELWxxDGT repeat protein [Archangium violaceum]|uniref:ELWxxDGT repeat protein n=1 Tax=Archangium violaceum TaxID=83451 RepID=UPI0037BEC331
MPSAATDSAAYFLVYNGLAGSELWKTDGTPEGTRLVRQFIDSGGNGGIQPSLAAVRDNVYLTVYDENLGARILKSDGTPEGTVAIQQPAEGPVTYPSELTACNDRVFFRTYEGIWTLDGTPERPVLLAPAYIFPEEEPRNSRILCAEGTLFFVDTANSDFDAALWKTDGTPEGTVRLASLGYVSMMRYPVLLAAGSRVFVNTSDLWQGTLWTSDGTPEGTVQLEGIDPDQPLTAHATAGGNLFFSILDYSSRTVSLWKSDGTRTQKVVDLPDALQYPVPTGVSGGNTVLFSAFNGHLMRSDGTPEGTFTLQNNLSLHEEPQWNSSALLPDGRLLFSPNDQLWVTDGSVAGTTPFLTAQGQGLYAPTNLTRIGNRVVFWAHGDLHGMEPWVTDGTPGGTRLLQDTYRADDSDPQTLTDVAGTLFFSAWNTEHGFGLWKSDGTTEGTTLVKELGMERWQRIPTLTSVDGTLFFFRESDSSLWKSDGTEAGTSSLRGFRSIDKKWLTPLGSTVFFSASADTTVGTELWKTDGTIEGTVLVKDICPGSGGSSIANPTRLGDTLFFAAYDGVHGYELWKSDGSAAGTVLVKDLVPGTGGSTPSGGLAVGTALFFTADNGIHGAELWKTNGTAEGTVLVKDIYPGQFSSKIHDMVELGGTLFFTADDGVHGREMWKSDGTPEGTALVLDITPGADSAFIDSSWNSDRPSRLYALGGTLFFAADDGVHGYEPWKSDGTAAGTVLLRDVLPGPENSGAHLAPFVSVGQGPVAFSASDGVSGLELWTTDGTTAGTRRFADLYEGPASASPLQLTVSGSRLFFVADDGEHGRELWSVKKGAFHHQP